MLTGKYAIAAIGVMLFLLIYAALHIGISVLLERLLRRKRLSGRTSRSSRSERRSRFAAFNRLYAHIADLLAAVGWNVAPGSFAVLSLFLGLMGCFGGIALFASGKSVMMLAAIAGGLPYVVLRFRLVSLQMATRLEFLPAVELFYQCYLITGSRHIRVALQKTVEERRLPAEVQAVFAQLYRHLAVSENHEDSIRRFAMAFGHEWADYFGSILKIALAEGHNVALNLKALIDDMRKAQLANQQERHRLLEIRLANFTPMLFLALFVGINFRMNPEASYQAYMQDPTGRGMLLNAMALIFGSLLMGLYLSRRKM